MANKKRFYKLKKGDTLDKLARTNKYKSWTIIWKHKENKNLAKTRGKPKDLQAGDLVYLPVSEAEKKEVDRLMLALNLERNQDLDFQNFLNDEILRLGITQKILQAHINLINQGLAGFIKEIEVARKGIKNWATGVDVAATLATLAVSLAKLGKLAHKASKATAAELVEINAKLAKDMKKQIFNKHRDAARKGLVALKNTRAEVAHILNDSFDKITSPSFWAMTWVQYYKEGKSLSDSVTYDLDTDFNKKIAVLRNNFGAVVKDIKAEITRQKKSVVNLTAAISQSNNRVKVNENKARMIMEIAAP